MLNESLFTVEMKRIPVAKNNDEGKAFNKEIKEVSVAAHPAEQASILGKKHEALDEEGVQQEAASVVGALGWTSIEKENHVRTVRKNESA